MGGLDLGLLTGLGRIANQLRNGTCSVGSRAGAGYFFSRLSARVGQVIRLTTHGMGHTVSLSLCSQVSRSRFHFSNGVRGGVVSVVPHFFHNFCSQVSTQSRIVVVLVFVTVTVAFVTVTVTKCLVTNPVLVQTPSRI